MDGTFHNIKQYSEDIHNMSGAYMRHFFLQWPQVHNGLTNQYTKLNTNQAITLVNISILMWAEADTYFLFFQS